MIDLGQKDNYPARDLLKSLAPDETCLMGYERPERMPRLPDNWWLLCGYSQGSHEHLFVCETLEDAQILYDAYTQGCRGATRINWYKGHEVCFLLGLC